MTDELLTLRDYGVAFGDRVILSGVNLVVPSRGVVVLMGPAGTGKSTLLRTLAGFNNNNPSLRTWGEANFAGVPVGEGELPALVSQNARMMLASVLDNIVNDLPERSNLTRVQQRDVAVRLLKRAGLEQLTELLDESVSTLPLGVQRQLAIARTAAASPKIMFVDEPTTGVDEEQVEGILELMAKEAERRAVVVVLHNQRQAQHLGGETALLAGGWIQECRPTTEFFEAPAKKITQDFVRSGSCCAPSPGTPPEHLSEDAPEVAPVPDQAREYVSDSFGPRGFLWLKKGQLAGTPFPGLIAKTEFDLAALKRVGVSLLVSLTKRKVDLEQLSEFGIRNKRFFIPDMHAPTIEDALSYCAEIDQELSKGEVIAVHCKAGLGRTGTMLAAQLIWEGVSAMDALNEARRIEPRWVQSDVQVEFLEKFERAVVGHRGIAGGQQTSATAG